MATDQPHCIGMDGTGDCRYYPAFIVAGDGACVYHLVAVTRMRVKDCHGPVVIQEVSDPTNGYDVVALKHDECPDGGTCHHECRGACFRVLNCGPLSIVKYPNDEWPADIVREHEAIRERTEYHL